MLTLILLEFGGGLLRPESNSSDLDARQSIVGSFIIVQAESIEAVWEILHKEIFYVSGEVVCEVLPRFRTEVADAARVCTVGSREGLRCAGVCALQGGQI